MNFYLLFSALKMWLLNLEVSADKVYHALADGSGILNGYIVPCMVELEFDEDTFGFHISQQGKEPFDFNMLSSGYQALLDIVLDIMMWMQHKTKRSFVFNIPGIVIIDEIDVYLHLELQKIF